VKEPPMKSDNFDKVFTGIIVIQIASALLGLGLLGALIYVAIHFLGKVW
jgi:hypothetical protein